MTVVKGLQVPKLHNSPIKVVPWQCNCVTENESQLQGIIPAIFQMEHKVIGLLNAESSLCASM